MLAGIARRDIPDRDAPDYKAAYDKIERKWRKRDEQPDENPQQIAAFSIHRFPVLHAWFQLFAPRHRATVEEYLPQGAPRPGDDHPVIYVSWFDAWAFCQWANWRDPEQPGRLYKVRLPHESEWEYAVRWRRNRDGKPVQSGEDRYWWGNEFYTTDEVPEDPTPRPEYAKFAHVDGRPGATGAPGVLWPNGLGLYDTLGNVWEWMANIYDIRAERRIVDDESATESSPGEPCARRAAYSRFAPRPDQPPPLVNALRTMRGGLWYYLDLLATCTSRYRLTCDDRDYKMGFRLVREQYEVISDTTVEKGHRMTAKDRHRQRTDFADVLIVTAVLEEWDAVLSVDTGAAPGSSWVTPPGSGGPQVRYRDFTGKDGELRVAVVRPYGMGGGHAVSVAAPLLERYPEIRCLAMCGVCAGRRGEVALGDVIIADRAWPYDAGKRRGDQFEGDMDLYRIRPREWGQRAESFQIDPGAPWIKDRPRSREDQGDWLLARLASELDPVGADDRRTKCPDWFEVVEQLVKAERVRLDGTTLVLTATGREHISRRRVFEPDGLRDPGPFKIVYGPIATGAAVVQDPTIFRELVTTAAMRKVKGLEMETSAILMLAELSKLDYAIVMKGVMDYADVFKSDDMKRFAARASAECLIAFLRENLPTVHSHAPTSLRRVRSS